MSVFVESKNLIFVHVPKTGGTSIAKWLVTNCNGVKGRRVHSPLNSLKTEFNQDAFSFAVVRNPWDRMLSYYFYIKASTKNRLEDSLAGRLKKSHKLKKSPEHLTKTLEFLNKGFDYFIKNDQLWQMTNMSIAHQTDIAKDVDLILKFENLKEDFIQIQHKLDCFADLPHTNNTKHNHYSTYYTQETIDMVAKKFKDEITKYGYDFQSDNR